MLSTAVHLQHSHSLGLFSFVFCVAAIKGTTHQKVLIIGSILDEHKQAHKQNRAKDIIGFVI